MRCTKCGAENRDGRRFCAQCGSAMAAKCARCGASNEPGEKFCGDCGNPLAVSLPPVPFAAAAGAAIRVSPESSSQEAIEGERKTVTALFADIKGSTELEQDLDPEEARAIIDPALKLMIDAVRRYEGYIVQSTGDGIFALFGAPVAREDHPQRALYAALRMQEELRRYGSKLQAEGRAPIEIRVGVNTGEVVVRSIATGATQVEYTPIGHTTNLASRLQSIARTGSIVAGEATRKFCEGYFILKPLGATKVKGVSEPVNVYEVTGLGPLRTRLQRSAGRGLTKFVGRQAEMESLKRAAEQAKAGHGQIVAAMAEAGTGKSRLFFEFKAVSQSGWMVLEAFSVSHGKASAYMPIMDLLKSYFEILPDDDARKRREKIAGKIVILDRALEDTLPYLYGLLEVSEENDPLAQMDAQLRKRRSLDAVKRLLLRESVSQSLMLIFEDLHWIDDETQGLLNLLADSIGAARILLLVNYRPEYTHSWGSKTCYTQLRLTSLGRESAEEMLAGLLGESPDLSALKRLVIERSDGNPFFMEEMIQELFEQEVLARNGTVKLVKSMSVVKVPATVEAVLASRIDRLPAEDKALLQMMAVIGTEFPAALLREVAEVPPDELDRMLGELQLSEFIYEQPTAADVEYTFKHALTHDVAYNSVLIERRKILHERIAGASEKLYRDRLDDHAAELAHHYGHSSNTRKAVEYLWRIGRLALHRSAYAEGIVSLTRGLELLEKLPLDSQRLSEELRLQNTLLNCWQPLRSVASPESRSATERALQVSEQLGDTRALFNSLVALCVSYTESVELRKARELAERALAVAEAASNPSMLAIAHLWSMGSVLLAQGEFAAAREHMEKGLGIPEARWRSVGERAYFLGSLTQDLWFLGYPEQAVNRVAEATALAKSESSHYLRGLGLLASLPVLRLRSDREALDRATSLLTLAVDQGLSFLIARARFYLGSALAGQGRAVEGVAEMERAMGEGIPFKIPWPNPYRVSLASAYGKVGRIPEGLTLVAELLRTGDDSGERVYRAELHRLNGELLLAKDATNIVDAEESFREAIDVARAQCAKSWELRATTSLARLLAKQGKRDEARAMLAEIYNWFTEGFDTADLKDAKALLEALSQ